jgi:hypothetical protein
VEETHFLISLNGRFGWRRSIAAKWMWGQGAADQEVATGRRPSEETFRQAEAEIAETMNQSRGQNH